MRRQAELFGEESGDAALAHAHHPDEARDAETTFGNLRADVLADKDANVYSGDF
ncbi:hypothetical protein [Lichenibacterium dinghuense]|uniref:hypothetical protein n=1 Tax=Lichenibacterium dinghuense TaxID=2895977 RepID=UPI001F1642F9|nr:hypothetical protein [Lichenibacterium sp. 6Y81]